MTTTTRRFLGGVAAAAATCALFAVPATAAEVSPCEASDLSYTFGPVEAALGHRYADLKISLTDGSCSLRGAPSDVTFLDEEGTSLGTEPRYEGTETPYTVLTAEQPAVIHLHWTVEHGWEGGVVPSAVSLKLPGFPESTVVDWPETELIGNVLRYTAVEPATA
ncbi:DUF4232 domain-containing protein [Amycolatopsis pittospori]|uniref:DUF4232 domain-containing protein n=1 Tax=Amycolatopsis pittospori TaxID=2749434 RepID=UPI0015F0E7E7|nr:DUF4232 domain-containing protein [Amycolatopsis pittospori]